MYKKCKIKPSLINMALILQTAYIQGLKFFYIRKNLINQTLTTDV